MRGATRAPVFRVIGETAFQSTLPMRGATTPGRRSSNRQGNFNPHSPCGERLSINSYSPPNARFQSTLPMRGATDERRYLHAVIAISIHTPHAGSDHILQVVVVGVFKFQSTLPMRGATRCRPRRYGPSCPFQSTLPMRGATWASSISRCRSLFQSTLPMRGATPDTVGGVISQEFQSTLPMRGAT